MGVGRPWAAVLDDEGLASRIPMPAPMGSPSDGARLLSVSSASDALPLLFERNHCMTLLAFIVDAGMAKRWPLASDGGPSYAPAASARETCAKSGVAGVTISLSGPYFSTGGGAPIFSLSNAGTSCFSFIGVSAPLFLRCFMPFRNGSTMTVSVLRRVFFSFRPRSGVSSVELALFSDTAVVAADMGTWSVDGRLFASFMTVSLEGERPGCFFDTDGVRDTLPLGCSEPALKNLVMPPILSSDSLVRCLLCFDDADPVDAELVCVCDLSSKGVMGGAVTSIARPGLASGGDAEF